MLAHMPRPSAALEDADALVRRIRFEMGREIREARLSGGTSLRAAAASIRMSHTHFRRLERGEIERLTLEQLSRGCAAVGLQLLVRALQGGGTALDAGQLALINRLRAQLPAAVRVRTEVPLPIQGDRRAWDAMLDLDPDAVGVEAEARLRDAQALDRKCGLKLRDAGLTRMVLLVADTKGNRRFLELYREDLRATFPLDTRPVMAAVRTGRTPEASGIVVL